MTKFSVPKSRIPKLQALCPKCGASARSLMSQAYADGYQRRHACTRLSCGHKFYSLAPYNGGEAQVSTYPFRDRPLTEAEESLRMRWWAEEVENSNASLPSIVEETITRKVTADTRLATIERMAIAVLTPEEERTHTEIFLADMHSVIEKELEQMDAQAQQEKENGESD